MGAAEHRITKESRKIAARAVIDRNRVNVLFPQSEVAELNAILETSYAGFVKRVNPKYPSDPRHLYAIASMSAFSWNEAISPSPALLKVKKAMRGVTQELLREYLESLDDPACGCCGSRDDLTADHTPPFDMIATEFMASHGVPEIRDSDDGVGDVFSDLDTEAQWVSFHQSRVTLSVLCRSCNSSKGTHGECRMDHADGLR